ncbi:hypothetical protein AVEN_25774-1 [Araneus ventricosus]|uniref:Uncharacterized protein n=1 Tax=Araneus ventricosus TaxID=182803 RepID=A0A4Y2R2H3_ARAVE|nr:hypothetical protein AVEN_25774-1 [Araneus ventricosus]
MTKVYITRTAYVVYLNGHEGNAFVACDALRQPIREDVGIVEGEQRHRQSHTRLVGIFDADDFPSLLCAFSSRLNTDHEFRHPVSPVMRYKLFLAHGIALVPTETDHNKLSVLYVPCPSNRYGYCNRIRHGDTGRRSVSVIYVPCPLNRYGC